MQDYPIKIASFYNTGTKKSPETLRRPEIFIECSRMAASVLITQLQVSRPQQQVTLQQEQPQQPSSSYDV